ncbi:hypothetical protein Hypma_001875 [Hypsizygus marmoreus]|uniref:Protein kinase domain-containing protein n=1 Tax=Hypsizygus marmoreus TaxID=39966 RepID=A0A369JCS5_HYPMA|nr:hypothetical protein Hypma_001875 [Hypsizygus marmoreus]
MSTLILFTKDLLHRARRPNSDGTLILHWASRSSIVASSLYSLKQVSEAQEILKPDDSESSFLLLRANLEVDDGSQVQVLDAVLKVIIVSDVDDEIRLTFERDAYETHGDSLSGFIPEYYGLFETTDKYARVLCLVTKYSGEPMIRSMGQAEQQLNWKVIAKVAKLHALGFRHGRLVPRNILHNDATDDVRFIDLRSLKPHKCERHLRIKAGCLSPDKFYFGCDELYELVWSAKIWKSHYVKFLGVYSVLMPVASVEEVLFAVPSFYLEDEKQRKFYQSEAELFLREVAQIKPEHSPLLAECSASEDVV